MEEDEEAIDWDQELRLCARYGELDELLAAIQNGADVNSQDEAVKNTALHYASANGHVAIVDKLLERGAEKDAANESGNTALHWAAQNGHTEVVLRLLNAGVKPALENTFGRTPLDEAELQGRADLKRVLIEFSEAHPKPAERVDDDDDDSSSDSSLDKEEQDDVEEDDGKMPSSEGT